MKYFLRVFPYLKPYQGLTAVSVAMTIGTIVAGLLLPWPLKVLIDNVLSGQPLSPFFSAMLGSIADGPQSLMIFAVLSGFALALVHEGFQVISKLVNTRIEQKMVLDFRSDLFSHAQSLSMSYHDQRRIGGLIFAINAQAGAGPRLLMTIPPMAYSVLMLIGMFLILLTVSVPLALVALAVVPFLYVYVAYYATHIQKRLRQVRQMEGQTLSIVHEGMSMFRVIAAFGLEPFTQSRFRNHGVRSVDARLKLTLRETLFNMAVNTTTAAGTAAVLGIGAYQALRGDVTPGQLLVAVSYLTAVYKPLTTISYTIGSFQEMFVNLQIAFNLLDTEPQIRDSPNAVQLERAEGRLVFDKVEFTYEKRKRTLENISFEVEPGMTVGIVGPTGAGKTTLVSLIPRFHDPTAGQVRLDSRDIREITLKSLRKQISIVLQEPVLFSGTIAENIRYGRLDASTDEVQEAAKAAKAHDFIVALPKKYKTDVGERGVQLSGGERQRISVARAFLKDAPILILDEPTSSVDSRTESVILEALGRLMVGRTTFMIAHRISTVRRCDLILVLDTGRIVEAGSHEDLMRLGGLYRELYEIHSGESEIEVASLNKRSLVGGVEN